MNHTTADYLNSLQNDLSTIKTNLANGGMEISSSDNFSDIATKTDGIQIGGGSGYTGHADVQGLAQLDWTTSDIEFFEQNGIEWNAEDDDYYKVSQREKDGTFGPDTRFAKKGVSSSYSGKGCLIGVPYADTSSLTDLSYHYSNCYSLKALPSINVSSATNLSYFYNNCYSIKKLNLSDWNVSNVTNAANLFCNCYNLLNVNLNTWNLSSANLQNMFNNCQNIENINLSNMTIQNPTNMQSMFNNCYKLKTITFPNIANNSDTSLYNIFANCYSLETINASALNIKTSNPGNMFNNCSKLKEIDLSNLELLSSTSATYMFGGCQLLEKIDLRKAVLSNIVVSSNMFGRSSTQVPSDCLIIVKDATEKAWMNSTFSRFTNVKTVEEYNAMQ